MFIIYCEVILDISHAEVDRTFTYRVPDELSILPGMLVALPFGARNAKKEGFVIRMCEHCPEGVLPKEILETLLPYPVLLPDQIELAEWIAKNYNCLLVDALRLMIPSQLRGSRVHEKIQRAVSIPAGSDVATLRAGLFDKSGKPRSPKQLEVFDLLAQRGEMLVSDIAAFLPNTGAAINALEKRGYIIERGKVTFRRPTVTERKEDRLIHLNQAQQLAVDAITASLSSSDGSKTFLLHGVTGSGKTEVYMHCIAACVACGTQAIVLVPEISLTPQTVGLFQARFGDDVAVLHSRLSVGERFDEWRRIRLGKAHVVIGARSAIFAPLPALSLMIIDEEHEPSYQSEATPRYSAIEVALHRSAAMDATLVLGSATPSLLSYYRATSGRYTLLNLSERVAGRPLPDVEIVDMREEFTAGNNGIFSGRLVQCLTECIASGKQAMLFLNRRGYSTFVSCRACGEVIQCPNCDISMTYHKAENRMKCHFCGETLPLPEKCPSCGKPFMKYFGVGTEQVEEAVHALFPDLPVLRMDTDTMKRKDSMQQMLDTFSRGDAKILIGTQMIAKGHDFPNVTLVGVVAADSTLSIPDYRSTERTFQLLTQVEGRAGRDETPGHVVVQTYSPEHPAIRFAKAQDYPGFFKYELAERRKALFPPYSLFLRVLFSGIDEAALSDTGENYAHALETEIRKVLGEDKKELLLFIASPAPIKKKLGMYRYQILIKLLRTKKTAAVIRTTYEFAALHRNEQYAMIEVNPQDMF